MRRATVVSSGAAVWFVGGAAAAALLTLAVGSWSNCFAISGIALMIGTGLTVWAAFTLSTVRCSGSKSRYRPAESVPQ